MARSATATRPGAMSAPRVRTRRVVSESTRPRLTVVTRPRPRTSSVPFTILCSLIIAGTLLTVLLLNISMTQTSYELTRLRGQSTTLSEQQQALQEKNEQLGTPQELEKRATELGMVPAGTPAYIDLATGKVVGEAQPAAGSSAPSDAQTPAVPAATIYGESEPYYGMGNEGH